MKILTQVHVIALSVLITLSNLLTAQEVKGRVLATRYCEHSPKGQTGLTFAILYWKGKRLSVT